ELSQSKLGPLIESLHAFDEIRFKLLSIPTKRIDYNTFHHPALEQMAEAMDLPKDMITPNLSVTDLWSQLFQAWSAYRNRQHLEYFHKHLHKVLTLRSDTKPFDSVEDFITSPSNMPDLERVIRGLNLNSSTLASHGRVLRISRADAIKKALLVQIWYSENEFSDDQLKQWGLFPRIFDLEKFNRRAISSLTVTLTPVTRAPWLRED
ncbi:hypothetical protein BG003_000175, partial [Podila horticola]